MGSEMQKPNHLKSRQKLAILSKTIWNLDQNVLILNGLDYARAIAKAWPFENRTIWNLDHLKSNLPEVRISNVSNVCGYQLVRFQVRTVPPSSYWNVSINQSKSRIEDFLSSVNQNSAIKQPVRWLKFVPGQGWDRHLFALRTLAGSESGPMPGLFTDPSYTRINQVQIQ